MSIFKRKRENTVEVPQDWALYFSRIEDNPAAIRLNLALDKIAPIDGYKYAVSFSTEMLDPSENGFPKNEEFQMLNSIEDDTTAALEGKDTIMAAVIKCNGLFEIYLYAKTQKGHDDLFRSVMKAYPQYSYSVDVNEDAEWDTYFNFLYPNDYEFQTIQNQRVLVHLQQRGDNEEMEREVDHFLYFPTEESREKYIRQVEALSYKVLAKEKNENNPEYPYTLNISRQDNTVWSNVNEYVWELISLAKECDGLYDGWGCPIAK